jgi:hypothetical protein
MIELIRFQKASGEWDSTDKVLKLMKKSRRDFEAMARL